MALPLGSFWRKFYDLIPKPAKRVATVVAVHSGGRYLVELMGGANLNVMGATGQYAVGEKVFLTDETIEGKAPSLNAIVIDV